MSSIKFIIEDKVHTFDLARIMSSEAIALEEDWGISIMDFETQIANGKPPMRTLTALVWLMLVRDLAAEKGVAFLVAAKELPAATFDVNLAAIQQGPAEPENPTSAGTRTPGTRTTRATSARKSAKRVSGPAATATSESSPSS